MKVLQHKGMQRLQVLMTPKYPELARLEAQRSAIDRAMCFTRSRADLPARRAHLTTRVVGVDEGDRVAIMLPNSIEFFEAWAGASKAGASVVPVNWHLKADELACDLVQVG